MMMLRLCTNGQAKVSCQPQIVDELKKFSSQSQWEEACSLLAELSHARIMPHPVYFATATAACARAASWRQALLLVQAMGGTRISRNIVVHNSAINACTRAKMWQQSLGILTSLSSESLEPSTITLNCLITACEKAAKWQHALLLLSWAGTVMLKVDTVTFNSALSACEKGSQWLPVLNLLQEMGMASVEADSISNSAALCALERSHRWKEVLQLYRQMGPLSANQAPAVGLAIRAFDQQLRWQAAGDVLRDKCQQSLRPDVRLVGCTVSCFSKAAAWPAALSELYAAAARSVNVDNVARTAATSAQMSASQWQLPIALLGKAVLRDDTSLSLVLSSLEKANRWKEASCLYSSCASQKVRPGTVSSNAAVAAARGASWQTSQLMLAQFHQAELRSDVVTFSSCMAASRADAACDGWIPSIAMLDSMQQCHATLNTVVLGAILSSLETGSRWQTALDAVRVAEGVRALLNGVQIGTVACCLCAARGSGVTLKFLDNARQSWLEAEVCARKPQPSVKGATADTPRIFAVSKPHGCSTEQLLQQLQADMRCSLSIASRLDYGTSGVLPIARGTETSAATRWLQAQFTARAVHKNYLCLCVGDCTLTSRGRLNAAIVTSSRGLQTWISEVSLEGSEAVTEYSAWAKYEDPGDPRHRFCLLSVKPLTGRTHQIRVHMASIGLPIVGDAQYGKKGLDPTHRGRLFLHCYRLKMLGLDGRPLLFVSELPQELQLTLMRLRLVESSSALQELDLRYEEKGRESAATLHRILCFCPEPYSQARKNCRISCGKPGRRASLFQTQCVSCIILTCEKYLRLQERGRQESDVDLAWQHRVGGGARSTDIFQSRI